MMSANEKKEKEGRLRHRPSLPSFFCLVKFLRALYWNKLSS